MKPLYILIAIVLPYTVTAFIWWYVWSYQKIFSVASQACGNYTMLNNTPVFNETEKNAIYLQHLFMQRWITAFSVMAILFLVPCIPFSSYFLYRKVKREWRRYRKDQKRKEKDIAKAAKYREMREAAK